jgi:very-short-patch-repair endonuclease
MPESIVLTASVAELVSFAMHQAAIPVVGELVVHNTSDENVDGLTVELTCDPPVIAPRRWIIDRIRANSEVAPADKTVTLDGGMLYTLTERMRATVTLRVIQGEQVLDSYNREIIALARHEWGGSNATPELLAAFVTPNDPGIAEILRDASDKLREHGRQPSLEGYQSQSKDRVWEIASAIWSAVVARRLIYAEPPASFESRGQKIRLPSEVLGQRLATCLDTAVLFAAALEQVGLRPILCLTRGHALTGVWLQPATLLSVSTHDASDLRNYIALRELILFETTVVTSEPPATFSQALQLGANQIRPALDDDFVLALDIRQARARQVLPLPAQLQQGVDGEQTKFVSPPLDAVPAIGGFKLADTAEIPESPQGRLDAWKRRLLDLTKRNRLLNLKPSKTAIRLVCADAGKLEDALADGSKITIVPMETLGGRGGGRDEATLMVQRKVDFEIELARQALENSQVPARLDEPSLKAGIVELFRKAKSDLEEGGANTLFLAIGMLKWRESDTSTTWHLAPLLLVPARLERATAANSPKLMKHTDETVFNMTLLEMLRQDFDLRLPQLEGELPVDGHGVDVNFVMDVVRTAIRDVPGWEVLDDMVLSTFSFAKYLMWKDLHDHTDALREMPFVKHMIDTPRDKYTRQPDFIPAREHDDRIDPSSLLAPLSCDSSQVAAIYASGQDGDFVLEGPPGTGKSQTIANLIAHNLGLGRSVLFVAEKMTALNVVHDRLKKVGLGEFCLELHSSKASKRDVLAQLDRAWGRRGDEPAASWEGEAARLREVRAQLNALVRVLHTPGPTGLSPREAIARATTSRFAPQVRLDWPNDLSHDRAIDRAGLERLRTLARELGQAFGQVTPEDAVAFAPLRHTEWSFQWSAQLGSASAALTEAIDIADASAARFLDQTKLPGMRETMADLQRLADFARGIPLAAGMNLEVVLAPDGQEVADRLRQGTELLSRYRDHAKTLSVAVDHASVTSARVASLRQSLAEANRKFWPFSVFARKGVIRAAMQQFGASQTMNLSADITVLQELAVLRAKMSQVTDALPSAALWRGLDTDVTQVDALIGLGEAARASAAKLAREPGELPELRQKIRTLFVDGRDLLQPGMPLVATASDLVEAVVRARTAVDEFVRLSRVADGASLSLARLRELAAAVSARTPRLNPWCKWQERRESALSLGLSGLVTTLETGLVKPKETTSALDTSYARWIAPLLIDSRDELRRFQSVEHEHLLDEFRKLDTELAKLAAETVRARASAIIPRKSDPDVHPGFSMLRREVQRKIGHAPVRKLVQEMGPALTRLTPCVLMSPHSVAQYLAAGQLKFDLVVFDEASQIAVWDAIGAIARGRSAIIVGDPKQMPPTNFFSRGADADDSSDSDGGTVEVSDLESILDEGLAAGMHHHRLTGHYRSQHESLIAFSNHRYYNGELVTYPACITQQSMVSLRRIDGAYQMGGGRTNPEEAKAVVAEIVARLTDPLRHRQTIGVVTMNAEQQRLIRNLLDDERRKLPALEAAFKDASGEEIEMVYNLETVQGHERDVIMLSIGYGPKVAGDRTMSMNFGPLNRTGGERRLNVAVTRAIREVVVFVSFDPNMIDLTRTQAKAVHDLKGYLDFAKRGPVALAREAAFTGGLDEFESVFEERVALLLREKGWTVQTQVGVSKFRIDLGIVHPDRPGRFLAGVECDGATYHSSPTARDRDRVRHAILSSLGWRLVRLWSTDFFLDAAVALGRVHDALEAILEEDRARATQPSADTANGIASSDDEVAELGDLDEASADFEDGAEDVTAPSDEGEYEDTSASNDVPPRARQLLRLETTQPDPVRTSIALAAPVLSADAPAAVPRAVGETVQRHDGAQFKEDAYFGTLRAICIEIIDRSGPITFAHLAEKVARLHGFQRTGSEIKKRVWAAVGRQRTSTRAPDGSSTFWPENTESAAHIPFRGDVVAGEPRPWSEAPYVERLGLAVDVVRTTPAAQRASVMAQRIGLERLRTKTRDELTELLESAEGMADSPRGGP